MDNGRITKELKELAEGVKNVSKDIKGSKHFKLLVTFQD